MIGERATHYDCPYNNCDWFLKVKHNEAPSQLAQSLITPEYAIRMMQQKIGHDLKAHLDGEHPGWSVDALLRMKQERNEQ